MKINKIVKCIVRIAILLIVISLLAQNISKAAEVKKKVELQIDNLRGNYSYAIKTDDHRVFQIYSGTGDNKKTNYFCVNANVRSDWPIGDEGKTEYDTYYDLNTDKSEISNLVQAYKNVAGDKYIQILWLLDNFAVGSGYNEQEILKKAGIVKDENNEEKIFYYDRSVNPSSVFSKENGTLYGNLYGNAIFNVTGYSYDDINDKKVDVLLNKDLIEMTEQAALWYFTNSETDAFDCYTKETDTQPKAWIQYTEGGTNWESLINKKTTVGNQEIETGAMLQEQASILFNYFIDGANAAAAAGYKSEKGTISISYTGQGSQKMVKEGSKYKMGPFKVTTTGNTDINGITVTTGANNDKEISDITLQNESGNTISTPLNNSNFYVLADASKINGNVTIKVDAKTTSVLKKFRVKATTNNNTAVQGVVEIEPKPENIYASISTGELFDLALRKVITEVKNSTGKTIAIKNESGLDATRILNIDSSTIPDSSTFKHRKDPIVVEEGYILTYDINIYNEGSIDGYASKIVDQLPVGLENATESVVISSKGNTYNVSYDKNTNKITLTLDKTKTVKNISAYNGEQLLYDRIKVSCKVVQTPETDGNTKHYLTNIAYITEAYDKDGNKVEEDRNGNESKTTNSPNKSAKDLNSSNPDDYKGDSTNQSVNKDSNNSYYYKGQEDDDDFEKVVVLPRKFDLSLRKFISKISTDGNFSGENVTIANREPSVDTSKLKEGTADTAIYNHSKTPAHIKLGDYILFTIRAYNEGNIDGYASQITDYLPENLDFVESTDSFIKSINDNWTYDSKNRTVTTKEDAINTKNIIKAFDATNDDGRGSGLHYIDVQLICKINKSAPSNKNITNLAEITEYKDPKSNTIEKDKDSTPNNLPDSVLDEKTRPDYNGGEDKDKTDNYIPGQEDDDDFEKLVVENFDLALRKFITEVAGNKLETRIPQLSYDKNGNILYSHPKDNFKIHVGDTIVYTLRVYNEGEVSGYAEKISDDIPEYLEFLPENDINKKYGWVMYDKDGKETTNISEAKKIVTKYLSKENSVAMDGAMALTPGKKNTYPYAKDQTNLLLGFNSEYMAEPDHLDVQVAFKAKDPGSNKTVITNKAQISEDADENGNPVEDIDSTPDEWNDGEDDQDYENVSVEYFDLALLKYVTKAIVTENGKTTTTNTGNNGSSTDITPKVEINRKRVNSTIVKFEYVIKITNEGDIAGYAKEITDYVPTGLKFYEEDNKGWTDEGNNVISTKLLENTLLQPGQSATVKVILRWINGSGNLGVKTNIAEISKDYNEKGIPDRDSTPDNKKTGEDDIDDAPVLLTISTGGFGNIAPYTIATISVLAVFGFGIMAIRKYVL